MSAFWGRFFIFQLELVGSGFDEEEIGSDEKSDSPLARAIAASVREDSLGSLPSVWY